MGKRKSVITDAKIISSVQETINDKLYEINTAGLDATNVSAIEVWYDGVEPVDVKGFSGRDPFTPVVLPSAKQSGLYVVEYLQDLFRLLKKLDVQYVNFSLADDSPLICSFSVESVGEDGMAKTVLFRYSLAPRIVTEEM